MQPAALHQEFTARVRDLATDGRGIVEHPTGQVFFVSGVWPGETARFRVSGFKQRFGFAQLVALLEPAPERVTPPCPHHGVGERDCGGCPWQFMDYRAQCVAKEHRVRKTLVRHGIDERIASLRPAPDVLGYRNRAQFKTDGRQLGFVAAGSNRLAPIKDCPILTAHNRSTLHTLLGQLPNHAWKPQRKHGWTTLDVDDDMHASEVVTNQRRPFRQGNNAQNSFMRLWLAERLQRLDPSRTVTELFAGSGNFTEVIAACGFHSIKAVEGVAESVAQLAARELPGTSALCHNLFVEAECRQLQARTADSSVLVLDPPRDGFKHIASLLPKKHGYRDVFYISCDVATFSRDLQVLLEAGLTVRELQPLDLFPHTPHVELLCWLQT